MPREPTIQEQIAYYDRWNAAYRSGDLDDIDSEIRVRGLRVVELLRAESAHWPRILELGCGTGWLVGALTELGAVTAIDLSPRAIEIARTRGFAAEFICADFLSHDFGASCFDAVVCIETLLNVPDQPRWVEKMAQLLRRSGMLGLTTINKFVYERSSDIGPPGRGQVRHWLSKHEIRRLLAPYFDVLSATSLAPRGDQGILRLVNSYKLNTVLNRVFGTNRVRRVKERLGLGGGFVIMARRL